MQGKGYPPMDAEIHNQMAGHSTAFHAWSYKIFEAAICKQNMKGGIFFLYVQMHDRNLIFSHHTLTLQVMRL